MGLGICLVELPTKKWANAGSLLVGVSGSWLGGCLFWGWLRAHPVWHLPVEAIALPLAIGGLTTKWRLGSSFYLACLLGTGLTDFTMLLTGVMSKWPKVIDSSLNQAPDLLHDAAAQIFDIRPLLSIFCIALVIILISNSLRKKAQLSTKNQGAWLVASAALTTTLWIDGIFLLTALLVPTLSGLI